MLQRIHTAEETAGRPLWLTNASRNCPVKRRHYGKLHDFEIVPFSVDDLGARIVAGALEQHFEHLSDEQMRRAVNLAYEGHATEAVHWRELSNQSDDMRCQLGSISECEDDETQQYFAECYAAYEHRPTFNPYREYGISKGDFL